jgi:hypothetical protein
MSTDELERHFRREAESLLPRRMEHPGAGRDVLVEFLTAALMLGCTGRTPRLTARARQIARTAADRTTGIYE